MDDNGIPEHWSDISPKRRAALLKRADNEIFWADFAARFSRWGKAAQVILTLAALFFLFRDAVAEILSDWISR